MQWKSLTLLITLASAVAANPLVARSDIPQALKLSTDTAIFAQNRNNKLAASSVTDPAPYQKPAQFSQGAYCSPAVGSTLVDAQVLATGGDGQNIPLYYVAHSTSLGVVVGHQGTNTSSFQSILNDLEFIQVSANSRLTFLGSGVKLHSGFQDTWTKTADTILALVKSALSKFNETRVVTVGHSLGAAIALLDALYLQKQLPSATVTSTTFGLPRVGNPAFANAVDAKLPGFVHVVNGRDPVPHLPTGDMGFQHPSGEIWINPANSLTALSCPGQENSNCAVGVNPLTYNVGHHTGYYFNVHIAGKGANCPPIVQAQA
ncbi:hypothetical protein ACQY0O_004524 [Thecaphora frezii]